MESLVMRSAIDQIIDRLAEAGDDGISVTGGQEFTRNQQRTFQLEHINRDVLQRAMDRARADKLVECKLERFTDSGEPYEGFTTRDRGASRRVRTFKLTPEGVAYYAQRHAVPVRLAIASAS